LGAKIRINQLAFDVGLGFCKYIVSLNQS